MPTGPTLATVGRRSLIIGQLLLDDIPADRFARLPRGEGGQTVQTNHPAFVYGHLSLYPARLCTALGDDATARTAAAPEGWEELFGSGKECRDDPEGSLYPAMPEIVDEFNRTHELALQALERADDAAFDRDNPHPAERMRKMFPTVGPMATFYIASHVMLHLGQVSAWRRMVGLGSAMK